VFGDEGDEAFEVGIAEWLAIAPLPAEFVPDHALLRVEQGFTDDEMSLVTVL
jgi:hypothetical protein